MAVSDYRCAQHTCDKQAVAVQIMRGGALYGVCEVHLPCMKDIDPPKIKWLYPPEPKFADQRAHDVFWMTAEERAEQDRLMSRFANLQELADAESWETTA